MRIDLKMRILAAIGAASVLSSSAAACGSAASTAAGNGGDAASDQAPEGAQGDALALGDPDTGATPDAATKDATNERDPDATPTIRRPFLVGASLRSAKSARRDDWAELSRDVFAPLDSATDREVLDATTARRLGEVWRDDGLQEHASIAAFARFTMLLLAVGAPPDLVAASQRASLDEIAHARDCFALAKRYGELDAGPSVLDVHDALGPTTFADLVALTAEEGCVGETVGAALASEQLARAQDPIVRKVLERIARDEARHAELAWRFVAWALAEERAGRADAAGARLAFDRALERAMRAARSVEIRPTLADAAAWSAHGRLHCAEARAAVDQILRDVVVPCADALGRLQNGAPAVVSVQRSPAIAFPKS